MSISNLETHGIDQFVLTLKEKRTESHNLHSGKPVLYLKCWGSDYPYLGVEQQKRWLPAVMDLAPRRLIRN
jgi:hypothetical protein